MSDWLQVSRHSPCAVCGKPDWCLVAPDGLAHLCNRVQSDKPAKGGGWLHGTPKAAIAPVARQIPEKASTLDAGLWWRTARHMTTEEGLQPWADRLGFKTISAIDFLGAVTFRDMLCFPMRDGAGNICGIRTRTPDGQKRAIFGSRAGVFLASVQIPENEVLICEGPSDAAAAIELGFEPIGRASCIGQEMHVLDTLRRWGKWRATLCYDVDGPGINGANRLASILRHGRIKVRMGAPHGCKDLRAWLCAGSTRADVDMYWSQSEWC